MDYAATLKILVTAQTATANAALLKTDSNLKRTAAAANSSAASIDRGFMRVNRSGSAFNAVIDQQRRNLSALATGAKYAAGGIAVLGAVGMAKVVKDGLAFNATMESNQLALRNLLGSAKEARQFLDRLYETAKKTPFEFTDLTTASRRLISFGLDAQKTQRVLAATGDAIAAMGGGAEQIDRVTLALGQMQAKGKVSAEELLQLTEAGIPAYAILKKELGLTGDQVANIGNEGIKADVAIAALTRGMEKRFGGAAAKQAKTWSGLTATMADTWAQMTGAMTKGLFSELKQWGPEVIKTMERVTSTFQNRNLDFGEKVARSLDVVKKRLGPLWDEIVRKFDKADIGQKVLDGIEWAIPRVAENAGQLGLKAAEGLAKGFMKADALGKLFIAGAFVKLLGGWGLISALGGKIGTRMGTGVATGLGGALRGGLVGVGALAVAQLVSESKRTIEGHGSESLSEMFEGEFSNIGRAIKTSIKHKDLGGLVEIQNLLEDMRDSAIRSGERVPAELQKIINKADKARSKIGADLSGVIDKFDDFTDGGGKLADRFDKNVDKLNADGERFKDKFVDTFRKIARGSDSLADAIYDGQKNIGGNTDEMLKKLKVGELKFSLKKAGESAKAFSGLQRGGPINLGAPSGDTVPAMLERGEYVLNRNAVDALGKRNLDAINFGHAPRFQTGGVIEQALGPYSMGPIQYDPNHAGGNSHLHLDFYTRSQAIAYGKKMQQMGWNISEYSGPYGGFGGITTRHAAPGHYDGTAFDANTAADETKAEVAAVVRLLGGKAGAGMAEKIARVLLNGPDGPLKRGGQAALDKVRSAANKFIQRRAASSVGGGANIDVGGVVSRGEMRRLLGANDLPDIMGWVAGAESNWNPSLVNSIGATGLFQILKSAHPDLNARYNLLNAAENTAAAATLYRANGLSDWAASKYEGGIPGGWSTKLGVPFQRGGLVNYLRKGGKPKKKHKQPWTEVEGKFKPPTWWEVTGPAKSPGWFSAERASEVGSKLRKVTSSITELDEIIDLERRLADFDGVFSKSEIAGQISLNAELLGKLTRSRDLAAQGLNITERGLKRAKGPNRKALRELQGTFQEALLDAVGTSGRGGRLFDVALTLRELAALRDEKPEVPEPETVAPLRISELVRFAEAARLAGIGNFAGTFAKGGSIPRGQWGITGERGPEIVHGPATVAPLGGPIRMVADIPIEITLPDGSIIRKEVRAELRQQDRSALNEHRAGVIP